MWIAAGWCDLLGLEVGGELGSELVACGGVFARVFVGDDAGLLLVTLVGLLARGGLAVAMAARVPP